MLIQFMYTRDIGVFQRNSGYLLQGLVLADRWLIPSGIQPLLVGLLWVGYMDAVTKSVAEWVRFDNLPETVKIPLLQHGVEPHNVSSYECELVWGRWYLFVLYGGEFSRWARHLFSWATVCISGSLVGRDECV